MAAIVMPRCSVAGMDVSTYPGKVRYILHGLQGNPDLLQVSTAAHVKTQPYGLLAKLHDNG